MKNAKPNAVAVIKPAKVPTLKTGDDKEVADRFSELFEEAQNGMRKVMAFALFAWDVKMHRLKHGQFMPWLAAALPQHSYDSIRGHMRIAESALEAAGFKTIESYFKTCSQFQSLSALKLCPGSEILVAPEKGLPPEAIEIRARVFKVIDGKSARQLFAEFKQSETDDEGNVTIKRGRAKGHGGASKAQRAAAESLKDEAAIEAMNLWLEETAETMVEKSDDKNFGQASEKSFDKLAEACRIVLDYHKRVTNLRKKGKQD